MKNFIIITLFGLSKDLYSRLTISEQKKYETKLLTLLISVLVSNLVALEISMTVFELNDPLKIVAVCAVWSFLVIIMDILLVRRAFPAVIRLFFSIALVVVSALSGFSLLTKKDIYNSRKDASIAKVERLKRNYEDDRAKRYGRYSELEKQQLEYHKKVCKPEALNKYAGDLYHRNHKHCLANLQTMKVLKAELDKQEKIFETAHDKEVKEAENIATLGFFENIKLTIEEILSDWVKILGFIALSIILISLESVVFFTSLGTKDEEYQNLVAVKRENNTIKAEEEMKAERASILDQAAEEKFQADREKQFKKLANKTDDLALLNHIYNEYQKMKLTTPDMSAQIDKSFQMLLASKIAKITSEIEGVTIGDDNLYDVTTKDIIEPNDKVDDEDSSKPNGYHNTFYCTQPMKELADSLFQEANGDTYRYVKNVFDWSVKEIMYQQSHTLDHYKTAREVYVSKLGICGEQTIFMNALLKYKGLNPCYIHVDIDYKGKVVNHACTGIEIDGRTVLVDIAYQTFDISHQKWNKVTDNQLIENMKKWNQ